MGKYRDRKDRRNHRNNKRHKAAASSGLKPISKNEKKETRYPSTSASASASGSAVSFPPHSPESVRRLLKSYSKERLAYFLVDTAVNNPELVARIRAAAESDVSHRYLFLRGLHSDVTCEILTSALAPFGRVDNANVGLDHTTGRCTGHGFVLLDSRSAALRVLREPQLLVGGKPVHAQLASFDPNNSAPAADGDERRVYVSNVPADASPEKLWALFAQYGEIEAGPFGFDNATGKSWGYALIVYKMADSALRALQMPHKSYAGQIIHCRLDTSTAQKSNADSLEAASLAAVATPSASLPATIAPNNILLGAAAQNLALCMQDPVACATLLAQNPLLVAAALNPVLSAVTNLNPAAIAALNPAAAVANVAARGQALSAVPLLGSYQASQVGQPPGSSLLGGWHSGYPSY